MTVAQRLQALRVENPAPAVVVKHDAIPLLLSPPPKVGTVYLQRTSYDVLVGFRPWTPFSLPDPEVTPIPTRTLSGRRPWPDRAPSADCCTVGFPLLRTYLPRNSYCVEAHTLPALRCAAVSSKQQELGPRQNSRDTRVGGFAPRPKFDPGEGGFRPPPPDSGPGTALHSGTKTFHETRRKQGARRGGFDLPALSSLVGPRYPHRTLPTTSPPAEAFVDVDLRVRRSERASPMDATTSRRPRKCSFLRSTEYSVDPRRGNVAEAQGPETVPELSDNLHVFQGRSCSPPRAQRSVGSGAMLQLVSDLSHPASQYESGTLASTSARVSDGLAARKRRRRPRPSTGLLQVEPAEAAFRGSKGQVSARSNRSSPSTSPPPQLLGRAILIVLPPNEVCDGS